jgi:hypothetical protein
MPCRARIGRENKAITEPDITSLPAKNYCPGIFADSILYSNYVIIEDYRGMPAAESGKWHG